MAKGTSRPVRSGGRPPGRRGKGGNGPGPGYRPTKATGKPTQHSGDSSCCPMVAAVVSAKRGKFRLARRYAAWSVRLLAARVAW